MSGILILFFAIFSSLIGYLFYGAFLERKLDIQNKNKTPAHTQYDGIDYVPAKAPILLGHHFASIAGAGPIVGPIIALAFGWLPVYLWIVIGVIFIGAVHDFTSVIASIRHQGKSIGEIIDHNIGVQGKRLFLFFAWSTLILVIAVFLDIVAKTFTYNPSVATASILFILIAVLFGTALYRFRLPLSLLTILGIILLFVCMYAGMLYPITASESVWISILLIYIFFASILPVWILLQPRDYLNSFLLYALMIGAFLGIIFYHPTIRIAAFSGYCHPALGSLFPILFITVACGAISGFHSLVASGTTAKQLNFEKDARPIGFGGMLIEGILAIIAIIAGASLMNEDFTKLFSQGNFISIFSMGVSRFMTSIPLLKISEIGANTFTSMAVSAFALTSLDTATRLARFMFQEFFVKTGESSQGRLIINRYISTGITVGLGALLLLTGNATRLWPLFGAANQLLAALALLAVSVWLSNKKKQNWFTIIPMVFMYIVTVSALIVLIYTNLVAKLNLVLAVLAILLLILSLILAKKSYHKLFCR